MTEKLGNLPLLDGWVTLGEAAELLGISRQHSYRRAWLANAGRVGGWTTAHRIGSKPAYVVSMDEIARELKKSDDGRTTERRTSWGR